MLWKTFIIHNEQPNGFSLVWTDWCLFRSCANVNVFFRNAYTCMVFLQYESEYAISNKYLLYMIYHTPCRKKQTLPELWILLCLFFYSPDYLRWVCKWHRKSGLSFLTCLKDLAQTKYHNRFITFFTRKRFQLVFFKFLSTKKVPVPDLTSYCIAAQKYLTWI